MRTPAGSGFHEPSLGEATGSVFRAVIPRSALAMPMWAGFHSGVISQPTFPTRTNVISYKQLRPEGADNKQTNAYDKPIHTGYDQVTTEARTSLNNEITSNTFLATH